MLEWVSRWHSSNRMRLMGDTFTAGICLSFAGGAKPNKSDTNIFLVLCAWTGKGQGRTWIEFKESNLFYYKEFYTWGKFYSHFFQGKQEEWSFCCGSKSSKMCKSRLHCWEPFTCSVAVPEPVLPTVPRERGCSFCLRNSSQAWPTHLFWSVSATEQPPFISFTQNCLPNGKSSQTPPHAQNL